MKAQVAKAEVAGGWKVAISPQFLFIHHSAPSSLYLVFQALRPFSICRSGGKQR